MSSVWVFNNGVFNHSGPKRKVLVHIPSGEAIWSHEVLEAKLTELGWERHHADPNLRQYHKPASGHLISFPKDFAHVKSIHMYDLVVKDRDAFRVVDAAVKDKDEKADADKAEAAEKADADQAEVADAVDAEQADA